MFIDLDRFKVINDSLGHMAGDELLIAIARRLEICLRDGDTVARLGGDEFTILLDGIKDYSDAQRVAERVQEVLEPPFGLSGREIFVTASIGIRYSSGDDEQPEDGTTLGAAMRSVVIDLRQLNRDTDADALEVELRHLDQQSKNSSG